MTQQKQNGKLIAIITMIFLFGMISFVTNWLLLWELYSKISFPYPMP